MQISMVSLLISSESSLNILKRRKLFIIFDFLTVFISFYILDVMFSASFWYRPAMDLATVFMNLRMDE